MAMEIVTKGELSYRTSRDSIPHLIPEPSKQFEQTDWLLAGMNSWSTSVGLLKDKANWK